MVPAIKINFGAGLSGDSSNRTVDQLTNKLSAGFRNNKKKKTKIR